MATMGGGYNTEGNTPTRTSLVNESKDQQDDDLLSSATLETRSETPEDLRFNTLSRPLALGLATVFEELADKLTVIGYSLATPFVDLHSRYSLELSMEEAHRRATVCTQRRSEAEWEEYEDYESKTGSDDEVGEKLEQNNVREKRSEGNVDVKKDKTGETRTENAGDIIKASKEEAKTIINGDIRKGSKTEKTEEVKRVIADGEKQENMDESMVDSKHKEGDIDVEEEADGSGQNEDVGPIGNAEDSKRLSGSFATAWLLRQDHPDHVHTRFKELIRAQGDQHMSATDVMKRAGLKANSQPERLQKLRIQLHLLANDLVTELVLNTSFRVLEAKIEKELVEQEIMREQYKKLDMCKEYIQQIKAEIKKTRMEQISADKIQKIQIHNLKDLQLEQDFRSNLEEKYERKHGNARVILNRRYTNWLENKVVEEVNHMKRKNVLEFMVHDSMVHIIEKKLAENSKYMNVLVEKYDKDLARLTAELETLCSDRKRDLDRIAWLKRRIMDYERIVNDNRRIKQREEEKRRKKQNEIKKATKVQAWWRGTMVRKWLGSFAKLFPELYERRAQRLEAKRNKKGGARPKPKPKSK